ARKLWIAFALPPAGRIVVDDGARKALEKDRRSLLSAGIVRAEGSFSAEDAVELVDETGAVFAKGLVHWSRVQIDTFAGSQSCDLPEDLVEEVVHRDDLVILP
ncbi:MAG: PUA domain-containing protein, partial [Actinomycetota bacterium]